MTEGLAERRPQSTALPVEIGFLADHGHPPDILHQTVLLASLAGVTADEALLKHGLVGETEFYRALAAELGTAFLTSPQLSREVRYPFSLQAGLAPLAGPKGGFVATPRGAALTRLLTARQAPPLAITTPTGLRRAVFRAKAGSIAGQAASELRNGMPDLALDVSYGQIAILFIALAAVIFFGFLLPLPTLTVLGAVLSPLFLGMIVLRVAATFVSGPVKPAEEPRAGDADLPIYTIITALYREKRVAARLIQALSRLDYPAAKLDIKLVLEADDPETWDALQAIAMPGNVEIVVAPQGSPRTKPRALNVALPLARGRYTVVYDAEDVPDPGQLRLAVARFAELSRNVACLQARLTIDNTDDSWLTRLFTIEYAALFDAFNPGLAEIGSPVPLGGTSNHFRTSILRDIHGWDAWNVTEDADLGIRLARLGYEVVDLPSSTLEEAPVTLRAWMRQRTRWMKGFVQTAASHSRKPWVLLRQLGIWRFCGALVLTWGIVLSALVYPFFSILTLVWWTSEKTLFLTSQQERIGFAYVFTLSLSGAASIFIPALLALHRRRLWRLLPWMPLLPFYYGLVSIAAWRGLWELATATFRWNKTSHGHARTSRSGII